MKEAILLQIKDINEQMDEEVGGDGEPLTCETLDALVTEKARLQEILITL